MHDRTLDFARRLRIGVAACTVALLVPGGRAAEVAPGAAILQDLRSFNTLGTLLHIGAHPDDENTALITYFARGRGYRTAYLSLTRGDGGQNEIGPEFDEKLGVARTQELLAARKLDGGRQFFTRAIDFGFSKSHEETLQFWDRSQVLADVVRVIRQFRPDVIVTRFPIPPGSGGHGHHTASGILGVEAFTLAGDPKAYPEQLAEGLAVWQAKRVAWNGFGPGRGGGASPKGPTVKVDIGGRDPVTGEAFSAIASRSRAMHITQFGVSGGRGGGGGGPNEQTFMILGGDPAENDIMDGVDTTWGRFPGGAEIGEMAAKAITDFKGEDLSASVPALLAIRAKLAQLPAAKPLSHIKKAHLHDDLPADPVLRDKREQLDRILKACLGLTVKTIIPSAEIVPGEKMKAQILVTVNGSHPVTLGAIMNGGELLEADQLPEVKQQGALRSGQAIAIAWSVVARANATPTQPYWLREEPGAGLFRVTDTALIGRPENPPVDPIDYVFGIGDQMLIVTDEPVTASVDGKPPRTLTVISPVSLRFGAGVTLFTPGAKKTIEVEVTAARAATSGTLHLEAPEGWTVLPKSQPFKLAKNGEKTRLAFTATAPSHAASGSLLAVAEVGGAHFSNQRIEIRYNHIPVQILQPPARARIVSFDFAIRGKAVGYLPGAGDDTAEALEQLGYKVTTLKGADLTAEKLKDLDAVVIGVRAFNERKDLAANISGLFAYVENGGTVIAQYNRPNGLRAEQLGPYPLSIQGNATVLRVTDEKAPVKMTAPDHPALTTPNRITAADFDGWFQERGTYFPSKWDENRYTTVLAMSDPGEAPLQSSLLIAKHGKGYYVYSGVAFFRQLPAGVPGAYRLFANLVSLGK